MEQQISVSLKSVSKNNKKEKRTCCIGISNSWPVICAPPGPPSIVRGLLCIHVQIRMALLGRPTLGAHWAETLGGGVGCRHVPWASGIPFSILWLNLLMRTVGGGLSKIQVASRWIVWSPQSHYLVKNKINFFIQDAFLMCRYLALEM